ncbi:hypothetical protein FP744_10009567 [Trichoderma asperellum]|nr:hypothetical protein LI328DRAFT_155869 [Trichoderma asperelloides]
MRFISALAPLVCGLSQLAFGRSTSYDLAVTTVFTQPPECTGGLTQVATDTIIWQNIINPAPDLTLTSCYPSQFYQSAMATASLPPFSQLVCPNKWEVINLNATYAICCPYRFDLYIPQLTNTQRPGLGAVCTSLIWPDVLMDVTSYDETALATVIPTKAGTDITVVWATAFDGILATPVTSPSGFGPIDKTALSTSAIPSESTTTPSVTSNEIRPSSATASSKSTSSTTTSGATPTSTNSNLAMIMVVAILAAVVS